MSNKIGAEGMGLYQLIFSIYMLAFTFATAGTSVAVTRLVSEEIVHSTRKTVTKILRRCLGVGIVLGLASAAVMFFGAEPASKYLLHDMRAAAAIRILAFSLPFMGAGACLRGYFIARRRVSTPSNAQIFEQLLRFAVVIVLLDRFVPMGIGYACVAVVIGNTVSEIASCLYMYVGFRRDIRRLSNPCGSSQLRSGTILARVARIAAPIMGSSLLNTTLHTTENLLVPKALTHYTFSRETSLAQFGMLKGMAIPILFFPASFLTALSTLLIPEISEASSLNQHEKNRRTVKRTIHITVTLSVLISGAFSMYASELGQIIYHSAEVGTYIKILAPIVPFMYMESIIDGVLRGLDQQTSALRYSVCDSVLRITMVTFLVPSHGIYGFLIIMVISNMMTSLLKIHRLLKVTNIGIQWGKWLAKPVISIMVAAFLTLTFARLLPAGTPQLLHVCLGILSLSGVYFFLLLLLGCITRDDVCPLLRRN